MAKKIKRTIYNSVSAIPGEQLITEALNEFLRDHKISCSRPKTIQWYTERINSFIDWLNKNEFPLKLNQITTEHINRFIDYCLDNLKNRPVTIQTKVRALKGFFNYLEKNKKIKDNPVKHIKKIKVTESMVSTFTVKQLEAILEQPNKSTFVGFRDRTIIALLMDTGIRISELVNIKVEDLIIDDQEDTERLYGFYVRTPKGHEQRITNLPPAAAKAVTEWLDEREKYSVQSPWLFPNIYGEGISIRTVQENIKKYGEQAGIEGVRCSPHTFRHTLAKMHLINGGEITAVKDILGHKSLEMAYRYGKLFNSDLRKKHIQFCPSAIIGNQKIKNHKYL